MIEAIPTSIAFIIAGVCSFWAFLLGRLYQEHQHNSAVEDAKHAIVREMDGATWYGPPKTEPPEPMPAPPKPQNTTQATATQTRR